ncbi:MAG: flagellin [Candidatus Krumholzibacteriota bacterium]|nr:flagellin [Candidatus Krumholzibacteriota bacterium]
MSFRISHNISSINALRNLSKTEFSVSRSLERLSSGLRVNRGADDPAGLVISESMRAQLSGVRQAIENAETATAMIQTAEGAMNEIHTLLNSIRELAIHAANTGANDAVMLAADQDEIDNAIATIDRIADQTQFGVKKLLDGSSGVIGTTTDATVSFYDATEASISGTYAIVITTQAEQAQATAGTAQTAVLGVNETLTINGVSVALVSGMTQNQVVDQINTYSSSTGATAAVVGGTLTITSQGYGANVNASVVSNVAAATTSTGVGTTVVTDAGVDIAGTIGGLAATGLGKVLTGDSGLATEGVAISTDHAVGAAGSITISNNSLVFQVGANKNQTVTITLNRMSTSGIGTGVIGNLFASLSEISVLSSDQAQDSIEIIDKAIQQVSKKRGELGVFQKNTLESSSANLAIAEENLVAAESVIRDTDFAQEMAELTKNQILLQSGTAMLVQANQIPQVVLQLLQQ